MITSDKFLFLIKEIIELCAIAKVNNFSMWENYLLNGGIDCNHSLLPETITYTTIHKEVLTFWKHDWLLNDGDYYIKLLTHIFCYLKKYVSIANLHLDLNQLIENKINDNDSTKTIEGLQKAALERLKK